MKRGALAALAILIAAAVVGALLLWRGAGRGPSPETIAAASLQGLREQNRLSAFAARFVAVVTSTQTRFGLSAKKTLILPGTVEYFVDLGALGPSDVRWNAASRTLAVRLPPVSTGAPQIDLTAVREYDGGGLLLALTDAEAALDAANRRAAVAELAKQARESVAIRLAREATRRAVAANLALPLKAAGIDATVTVRFWDEGAPATERWDESRSVEEIYRNGN